VKNVDDAREQKQKRKLNGRRNGNKLRSDGDGAVDEWWYGLGSSGGGDASDSRGASSGGRGNGSDSGRVKDLDTSAHGALSSSPPPRTSSTESITKEEEEEEEEQECEEELVFVLDGLRSAENVGNLLRTAETCGAHGVVTCGTCPRPPDKVVSLSKQ
jgi:hypothetical protein